MTAGLLAALVAAAATFPSTAALDAALAKVGEATLVLFDEPRPGTQATVLLATRVRARPQALRALLLDPQAYRRAVPAFRRAEVLRREGAALLVEWELEIPLWNLEGRLWLRPRPDGVDLELAEGDLAPGHFRLTARADGAGTTLVVAGRANVREASWVAKRLAARSAYAEPAMTAAAAWVLARAVALAAEGRPAERSPRVAPAAPPPAAIDGGRLAAARAALGTGHVVAAVRSQPEGRLALIEVAVAAAAPPQTFTQRLADPQRWRALPGWRRLDARPPAAPGAPAHWTVDSRFPFVDFDATWAVTVGPPLRAQVTAGGRRGAILGWDVAAGAAPRTTTAVFSLHPRLETTGYIPRKFIEAEPLLEHGLALGLAYVDALSLARAVAP